MKAFTQAKQTEFLEHIRAGMRRGAAADALALDRRGVREFILTHKDFEAAVLDAEVDANEHVEEALYQAAVSGNVAAAKTWLELTGSGDTSAKGSSHTSVPTSDDSFADLDNVEPIRRGRRER